MVGDFAERFGKHPDKVFKKTSFDTVSNFLVSWKSKDEFQDRYYEAEKALTPEK